MDGWVWIPALASLSSVLSWGFSLWLLAWPDLVHSQKGDLANIDFIWWFCICSCQWDSMLMQCHVFCVCLLYVLTCVKIDLMTHVFCSLSLSLSLSFSLPLPPPPLSLSNLAAVSATPRLCLKVVRSELKAMSRYWSSLSCVTSTCTCSCAHVWLGTNHAERLPGLFPVLYVTCLQNLIMRELGQELCILSCHYFTHCCIGTLVCLGYWCLHMCRYGCLGLEPSLRMYLCAVCDSCIHMRSLRMYLCTVCDSCIHMRSLHMWLHACVCDSDPVLPVYW